MSRTWTLRGQLVEYTITVPGDGAATNPATGQCPCPCPGRWPELVAWGPIGISDGPSPVAYHGPTPFRTAGDAAAAEYTTDADRPFAGADLIVETEATDRRISFDGIEATGDSARVLVRLTDSLTGLVATVHYEILPGTDVVRRWVELANTGTGSLAVVAAASAGFCVPTPHGAAVRYLWGQWAQEFQLDRLDLGHGRFTIGSGQGVPGHDFLPWLAISDTEAPEGPTWGVALAWTGSWEIHADRDTGGLTRVRVGRLLADGPIGLAPGERLALPVAAGAYSATGPRGLARVWHQYQRVLAGPGLEPRPVLYNSWEATGFTVTAADQLHLAELAAGMGVETFVVDDGWFLGRDDDTRGLGDWTPDPGKFPAGLDELIAGVRRLGMGFGLWVEPECVSPTSRLYAEHPDWVYAIAGRPITPIRNQYLLDLGRPEVARFVHATLDGLLRDHDIGYLKWDFNRPRTEPGRATAGPPGGRTPGGGRVDLDGAHVANLYRICDRLRRDHPAVRFEFCAGGGGRADLAMAGRADVLWPSDNTGPLDRLTIQHGFLHANAPHLLSSWVTDAAGIFDQRSRSLAFRFVLAMAGVLGIGADLRAWSGGQRGEAAEWIARYKLIRPIVTHGSVTLIGRPDRPRCAVQYTAPDGHTVVVLAWNTGRLDGAGLLPSRPVRLPLHDLDPRCGYRADRYPAGPASPQDHYSGSHLMAAGLPVGWTADHDAELIVLRRDREGKQ